MNEIIPRIGLVQRVLPEYRAPFFEMLGAACSNRLGLFAGAPRPEEAIARRGSLQGVSLTQANNLHLFHGAAYICWQSGLINWLRSWQPEVLILEANPRYLHSRDAVRWMHNRNRSVIGWGLGAPIVVGRFADLRMRFRRSFINQFDALVTYSGQGAAEYEVLGFPKERIFVAPNAVAPRPVSPIPARPMKFREGKPTALFVGRLQARKRVDELLRACAALPEALQPKLWVVGDGPIRADLEEFARQVYPAAEFLGAKHGHDLAPYFEQADVFVLPGTGGLAIQQAMSYGLPVIVGEADGTQTDLVRPENGWSLSPGHFDDLVAALQTALSDVERLRKMGEASYRIVSEEINLENMVRVFKQAISTVWEAR